MHKRTRGILGFIVGGLFTVFASMSFATLGAETLVTSASFESEARIVELANIFAVGDEFANLDVFVWDYEPGRQESASKECETIARDANAVESKLVRSQVTDRIVGRLSLVRYQNKKMIEPGQAYQAKILIHEYGPSLS